MNFEFRLPDIGEGVVEGEVVRWLVKEGDLLHEDQPMVEVMTDKATVEIPSPRAGRVVRLMYAEGQTCPVGKVLIVLDLDGDAASASSPSPSPSPSPSASPPQRAAAAPTARKSNGVTAPDAGVLATPATRKLARDLSVDIRQVEGTGRAGRITSDDVRAHGGDSTSPVGEQTPRVRAPISPAAAEGDVRIPFRGLRKKIAENMVRARQTTADVTYVEEVDCTDLVVLRARANERLADDGVKLSYLPFIIKATVAALAKFPQFNATLDEASSEIVQRRAIHIGLATATEAGLIVPVVRDAQRMSVVEIAREIERLAALTRSGKAAREDLSGSTFTISSLGQLGGVMATSIINYPEVAILGVHKISRRPAIKDDKIVARDLMNLSVSIDHRVLDGYDAARFVAEIKATLETPALLYLESV